MTTNDTTWATVRCDQCQALAINGFASHEQGCPNRRYPWVVVDGECVPDKGCELTYDEEQEEEW
jgi:hypothetical protein